MKRVRTTYRLDLVSLAVIVLGAGTRVFGTIDGKKEEAAGLRGFKTPDEPADAKQYDKLVQMPYQDAWMEIGNIGDLKEGSPVTLAGVRIGRVEGITVNVLQGKADVTLRIEKQYANIPEDSDASIQTAGLLGGKYIGIGVGGSETFLKEGSQIEFTQSAIVLESLVNKFFANFASKGSDSEKSDTAKEESK